MEGKTDVSFSAQVPDTMTSWLVTGFALSPTTGLGLIHEPITFKVEKTFYIVAHLPYSIKRGEVTVIQVMIYNFIGNTLITDVRLYNKNDEIEFVDQSSSDSKPTCKVCRNLFNLKIYRYSNAPHQGCHYAREFW